jgi:hypothetical protein
LLKARVFGSSESTMQPAASEIGNGFLNTNLEVDIEAHFYLLWLEMGEIERTVARAAASRERCHYDTRPRPKTIVRGEVRLRGQVLPLFWRASGGHAWTFAILIRSISA